MCETGELEYSSVLLGMLVMQDVQLGLFIAVMPTLIQAQSGDFGRSVILLYKCTFPLLTKHTVYLNRALPFAKCSVLFGSLHILFLLGQVLVSLAAVLLLCLLLKSFLIGPYYKKLHAESKDNKEILVLGMSAFVFFMLMVPLLNEPFLLFWFCDFLQAPLCCFCQELRCVNVSTVE